MTTGTYRHTRRKHAALREAAPGQYLAPAAAVAFMASVHPDTVRKWCQPVACDVASRGKLYDAEDAVQKAAEIRVPCGLDA